MSLCLIGLGSNLGDRRAIIDRALDAVARSSEVHALRASQVLETTAIGGPSGQPSFLNAAAVFETTLAPQAVLALLHQIEATTGRQRSQHWGPRTLDLDLLLYDEIELRTPELTLPHPRMAWRRFVLEPAAEIAGAMLHPATGWTIARLLSHLSTAKNYLAITGPTAGGKRELAERLAQATAAQWISDPLDVVAIKSAAAGSAGRRQQMELEFLDKRSRSLAVDSPVWASSAPLWISDFWFDECLAFAEAWCIPRDALEFAERWRTVAANIVRPKLTVFFDNATDPTVEHGDEQDRLVSAFRACLRRPDVGPVLSLTEESPEAAFEEVSAAVAAMR